MKNYIFSLLFLMFFFNIFSENNNIKAYNVSNDKEFSNALWEITKLKEKYIYIYINNDLTYVPVLRYIKNKVIYFIGNNTIDEKSPKLDLNNTSQKFEMRIPIFASYNDDSYYKNDITQTLSKFTLDEAENSKFIFKNIKFVPEYKFKKEELKYLKKVNFIETKDKINISFMDCLFVNDYPNVSLMITIRHFSILEFISCVFQNNIKISDVGYGKAIIY